MSFKNKVQNYTLALLMSITSLVATEDTEDKEPAATKQLSGSSSSKENLKLYTLDKENKEKYSFKLDDSSLNGNLEDLRKKLGSKLKAADLFQTKDSIIISKEDEKDYNLSDVLTDPEKGIIKVKSATAIEKEKEESTKQKRTYLEEEEKLNKISKPQRQELAYGEKQKGKKYDLETKSRYLNSGYNAEADKTVKLSTNIQRYSYLKTEEKEEIIKKLNLQKALDGNLKHARKTAIPLPSKLAEDLFIEQSLPEIFSMLKSFSSDQKYHEVRKTLSIEASAQFEAWIVAGGANMEYNQQSTNIEETTDVYMIGKYKVPKAKLSLNTDKLQLSEDFIKEITALKIYKNGFSHQNYRKLISILDNYGYFIPKDVTLGGIMSAEDKKKSVSKTEIEKTEWGFGVSFEAKMLAWGVKISSSMKKSDQTENQSRSDSSNMSLTLTGGDPATFNSAADWVASLANYQSWQVIEFGGVEPILDLLEEPLKTLSKILLLSYRTNPEKVTTLISSPISYGDQFRSELSLRECYENGYDLIEISDETLEWYRLNLNRYEDAQNDFDKRKHQIIQDNYGWARLHRSEFDAEDLSRYIMNLASPYALVTLGWIKENRNEIWKELIQSLDKDTSNQSLDKGTSKSFASKTSIFKKYNLASTNKFFEEAAKKQYSSAQYNLGLLMWQKKQLSSFSQNELLLESIRYHSLAANQNHIGAQYNLGLLYKKSGEFPKKAEKWLDKAAMQGHAASQSTLGDLYRERYEKEKKEVDFEKSTKWYEKASKQKYKESYGKLYSVKSLNPSNDPQSEKPENIVEEKDLRLLLKGAENKDITAQYKLFKHYSQPEFLRGSNAHEALRYYKETVDNYFNRPKSERREYSFMLEDVFEIDNNLNYLSSFYPAYLELCEISSSLKGEAALRVALTLQLTEVTNYVLPKDCTKEKVFLYYSKAIMEENLEAMVRVGALIAARGRNFCSMNLESILEKVFTKYNISRDGLNNLNDEKDREKIAKSLLLKAREKGFKRFKYPPHYNSGIDIKYKLPAKIEIDGEKFNLSDSEKEEF